MDEPVRKRALSDWLRDRAAAPPSTVQIEKHRRLFAAFNEFVSKHGAWVVSAPGNKVVRIECPEGSSLPIRLAELGYRLSIVGAGATRVTPNGIIPVDVIETKLPR